MKRSKYYLRTRRSKRRAKRRVALVVCLILAAAGTGAYFLFMALTDTADNVKPADKTAVLTPAPVQEAMPEPMTTLADDLAPHPVQGTNPSDIGLTAGVMDDGTETASYRRAEPISFGAGSEYTALEGVITFRGNNYRNEPSWGSAEISDGALKLLITKQTGATGNWGGMGWTGQPLIVKWPDDVRAQMKTLGEKFRAKEGFVEVIYASLSGDVYFMDLETGEKTRYPLHVGGPVKGTPSLDPRGYPILYVGQGLQANGSDKSSKNIYFRAYSLITGEKLMEVGAAEKDPYAYGNSQAYNASPLIDAKTDTLIYPGENGIVYVCDLNTRYNAQTGELTMDMKPKKVKYRYTSPRNETADAAGGGRWGIEDSPAAWRNYIFFTDNAGILQCVDLNTMTPVYAADVTDDSDVSMALEEAPADQTIYLYTGCEYDKLVRPDTSQTGPGFTGTAYARKIDGLTGEVVWEVPYTVRSSNDADGGILASPVLGKDGTVMEGLVIYSVTMEAKGDAVTSRLVALSKEDGSEVWSYDMEDGGWSPSSPVPVYTADGKGYIVQCDCTGDVALIDGETGKEVQKLNAGEGEKFEATPAVYGNTIVVASRNKHIFFITIS